MSDSFVEVVGQRVALLGRENGSFELWQWPIKVAHDLRFEITGTQLQPAPVRVHHHGLELSWAGGGAVVRARLFANRERRVLYALFEGEGHEETEVTLRLSLDYRPMWPAGLGGQIAARDEETGALLLTEERGRFATLIGSPDATSVEGGGDHTLGSGEAVVQARLRAGEPLLFLVAGAEREPDPLSEAAKRGEEGAAVGLARAREVTLAARGEWRRGVNAWRADLAELERHWGAYLGGLLSWNSSDPAFDRAFRDAQAAIEKAWVRVDGLGLGLVAGLGRSGRGERPGFGWFFDGDALIAARSLLFCGDHAGAERVLRFAASHQRADGKMMHELVLSARLCDWENEYPYAYYKADNGPRFPSVLGWHARITGDDALLEELRPAARRALAWCEDCLDEHGRMSNRKAGLAAVEAGPLVGRIDSEAFLHGLWMEALEELEPDGERLERARRAFETFWCESPGTYAFAQLDDGSAFTDRSAYLGLPLARGFGEDSRARRSAARLNHPSLTSDWGARMFALDSEVYDPAHYNTGSVFPYLNTFVALALYRRFSPTAGWQVLRSIAGLSGFSGETFIPEHLVGDRAETPERGVPHQIFSSSALIEAALVGLAGLEIDGRNGHVIFAPALPPDWDHLLLERVRVGESRIDLELRRERLGGETELTLDARLRSGPPITLDFAPRLAPQSRGDTERLALRPPCRATLRFREGPLLHLPPPTLVPGSTSRDLRVTGEELEAHSVTYELWGLAGETYRVPVSCDFPWSPDAETHREDDVLVFEFEPGEEPGFFRRTLRITIDTPPS